MHIEYLYRRLFPMPHEQYIDEPGDVIGWMLHIDGVYKRAEAKRAQ